MSNENNARNESTNNIISYNTNISIGRSVSSARFQIAKVSNSDTNIGKSLGKPISIPMLIIF